MAQSQELVLTAQRCGRHPWWGQRRSQPLSVGLTLPHPSSVASILCEPLLRADQSCGPQALSGRDGGGSRIAEI